MKTIKRRNYARGHGYSDDEGNKIKGVTTWLNEGTAKPALVNWAAKEAAGYAVDEWDRLNGMSVSERLDDIGKGWRKSNKAAMLRGTEIHALAEHLVRGEPVDAPEHVAGHVDQYARFLDDFDVEPVVVEGVIGNLDVYPPYAGTLDLIADLKGEARQLIDLKTGKGVYGEVGFQLAAYRYATILIDGNGDPGPMTEVDSCSVLHLQADSYALRPVVADEAVFRAFRHIQVAALSVQESRDWIGEEVRP